MNLEILQNLPQILQVILVIVLGIFAIVSILARFIFNDSEKNNFWHILEYTVIPTFLFLGSLAFVISNWNSANSFLGEISWWKTTGGVTIMVILGIIPSVLCFIAQFPLSKIADKQNPDNPIKTTAGILQIIALILSIILLPIGVTVAVLIYKQF